jgi:hypothetical protein
MPAASDPHKKEAMRNLNFMLVWVKQKAGKDGI